MTTPKQELYTTDQVLNKDMGFNLTMNRYICDNDKSEAIMHNNKTHVQTTDGRKWTLASTIVTIANAGIPSATADEPAKPAAPPVAAKK